MSDRLTLEEHLAVPYILDVAAVEDETGNWLCQLAYEELPGCVVRAPTPLEALDELERLRERIITELLADDQPVPVPRRPLRI
jgi:predicted RNase H-like HicB family nuclease